MSDPEEGKLEKFQKELGYNFKDVSKLTDALTHSSYANEKNPPLKDNEKLEFLGDAVLEMIISERLFRKFPKDDEGLLTLKRSSLVNSDTLAKKAKSIGINKLLRLGKGEEKTGGRKKESILANAFEALIGAIFLDGGWRKTRKLIWKLFQNDIEHLQNENLVDNISLFQEYAQINYQCLPEFKVVKEKGPYHSKTFTIEVSIKGQVYGRGSGKTKKEAKQNAAKNALKMVKEKK